MIMNQHISVRTFSYGITCVDITYAASIQALIVNLKLKGML